MDIQVIILGIQDQILLRVSKKSEVPRILNSLIQNCLDNFLNNLKLNPDNTYIFLEVILIRNNFIDF